MQVGAQFDAQIDRLGQGLLEQQMGGLEQLRQADHADLEILAPGKCQQLLGQPGTAPACIENMRKQLVDPLGVLAVHGQARRTENDGQDIVEVMGHAARELAKGLELLCLEQLATHFIELDRGLMPIGNVASNLGQADDLAVRVTDNIKRSQRPKTRAILANTPAFILGATGFQCQVQQPLRQPHSLIFRGKEYGKMLADGFVGEVALDFLCTGVPRDDFAVEVEHVDRVVNHRLHQLRVTAFMQVIQMRRVVLIHGRPDFPDTTSTL
ncbi:hypothetical protein D3C76_1077970 [compost metagenome]